MPVMIRGRALLGAVFSLALFVGGWAVLTWQEETDDSLEYFRSKLLSEIGPVRPIEARLTGFEYAPVKTGLTAHPAALRQTARKIQKIAEHNSSPEVLGALALLKLLDKRDEDRTAHLRGAIDLLEQATSQPEAGAHLWSDLAAVYLESAGQGAEWNYPRALQAALRATEGGGDLPEARFNLALALEKNFLLVQARRTWDEVEENERDAGWSEEAIAHRHILETPTRIMVWEKRKGVLEAAALRGDRETLVKIVTEFPFRARVHAETEFLPAWSREYAAGHGNAAAWRLQEGRAVGAIVAELSGEHMVEDSVAVIDQLSRQGESAGLADLAAAYRDYDKGAELCLNNQASRGESALVNAREIFERSDNPMSAWVEYYLGICAYQRSEWHEAIQRLRGILARQNVGRYPSLVGRVYWMIGLSHMRLGEPAAASDAYETGLSLLEKTQALPEVAGLNHLLAEAMLFVGERRQAWKFMHRGLGIAVAEGDFRRRYTGLDETADTAAKERLFDVALLFREEVVKAALGSGDAPGVTHAFLLKAETLLQKGRRDNARQELTRAKGACKRIDDPYERRHQEADILLAEGKLLAPDQPAAALAPLGRALNIYEATANRFPLVEVYLARARALLTSGDPTAAERDLISGIGEFERQRGELKDEELRIVHFDQARELFDLLIDLQADAHGGMETAFASAEQQRARVLLDRARTGRRPRPFSLGEVLRHLPDDMSLVAYTSLPERLLIWVLRRNAAPAMIPVPLSSSRLEELVKGCVQDIQRKVTHEEAKECLTALHETILKPALSRIAAGDRIVFVPDKSLHRIPFAALLDGETGRFLVEDHASAVSPSASFYIEEADHTPAVDVGPGLLVVSNPYFDRTQFSDLSSLSGAATEGEEIANLFKGKALVLRGVEATRAAFLREAGQWSIIHLGTHALLNFDHPHLSRLLLTPGTPGDPGALTAAEIQDLPLSRTRIVFLAACQSGKGALASEGILSLARSFLAAGVSQVVSTLWDIDDKPGTKLVTIFYRSLLQGDEAMKALRRAQLVAIREHRPINEWSAFQVLGRER